MKSTLIFAMIASFSLEVLAQKKFEDSASASAKSCKAIQQGLSLVRANSSSTRFGEKLNSLEQASKNGRPVSLAMDHRGSFGALCNRAQSRCTILVCGKGFDSKVPQYAKAISGLPKDCFLGIVEDTGPSVSGKDDQMVMVSVESNKSFSGVSDWKYQLVDSPCGKSRLARDCDFRKQKINWTQTKNVCGVLAAPPKLVAPAPVPAPPAKVIVDQPQLLPSLPSSKSGLIVQPPKSRVDFSGEDLLLPLSPLPPLPIKEPKKKVSLTVPIPTATEVLNLDLVSTAALSLTEASPVPQEAKAFQVLFASHGQIQRIKIDEATSQVQTLAKLSYSSGLGGWMAYSSGQKKLFVPSESGKSIAIYQRSEDSFQLEKNQAFPAETVHLTLVEQDKSLLAVAASYNKGNASVTSLSAMGNSSPSTVEFGRAHSHSTAVDKKRSLVFIANLAKNQIAVLKLEESSRKETQQQSKGETMQKFSLRRIKDFSVPRPRMLIYHPETQVLYSVSEHVQGIGAVKGYQIVGNEGSLALKEVLSQPMGLAGSDIKLSTSLGFVMALQREKGRERLVGVPLDAKGHRDLSRKAFELRIPCPQPRSLEVSPKGNHIIVGCETEGTNVLVFKARWNATRNFDGAELIFKKSLPGGNFSSSVLIE